MAYLQRLIALLVLLLASQFAHADFPATGQSGYKVNGSFGTTAAAACSAYAAYASTGAGNTNPGNEVIGLQCNYWFTYYGNVFRYSAAVVAVYPTCPANSALVGGSTCACTSGTSQVNGACLDPNAVKCGDIKGQDSWGTPAPGSTGSNVGVGTTTCASNGCYATVNGGVIGVKDGIKFVAGQDLSFTGDSCTPAPATAPTTSDCKGSVGQVNGITRCIPFDPAKNTVVSGTTSSTSGTPANAAAGTPAKPASTTTSQHTCIGSKCTTTTTTTSGGSGAGGTGAGSTTTSETKDVPKDDFCKENPRSTVCTINKLDSKDCEHMDICEGDAIACGIAWQTKRTACLLTPPEAGPEAALYNAAASKPIADVTGDITKTVNLSSSNFDQSDIIGTSSGLVDQTVTIVGKTVVIPWSQMNSLLAKIGLVMQACTFLVCARIVMRG